MDPTQAAGAGQDAVARALWEMALLLELRGESGHRVRAYQTAAGRLAQGRLDLPALAREGRLTELPGIGPRLASKVEELVTTGRSSYLESLRAGFPPGISGLLRVPSLGPRRAMALWEALGVGDLDALERACRTGAVRQVPGFGEKSEARLLEAIAQARARPEAEGAGGRTLLGQALPALEELAAALQGRGARRVQVAGEARRGCEEVLGAKLVAAAPSPKALLKALEGLPQVAGLEGRGGDRVGMRLFRPDLVVEVRVVTPRRFGAALLDATGSEAHLSHLRARAEASGLELTRDGLFRKGRLLASADEADLYRMLGLPLVPPELREGELGLCEDYDSLLEEQDVRGLVHSHSTWSDGRASLEEMAMAASAQGLRWMTVTEHSQTASYAGGLQPDALERQWEEIDRLNEQLSPFRLLKGIESDILKEGALDYPSRVLDRLEVVVGSIHQRHGLDERQTTARLCRALAHPNLHILGHATGRLLQRRPPLAVRMEEVLDAAALHQVAVEVNGSPHRLDLSAPHVRLARARGVKLVASADSHSVREIGNLRYAVLTARRGGARKDEVLNTRGAEGFLRSLRQAG